MGRALEQRFDFITRNFESIKKERNIEVKRMCECKYGAQMYVQVVICNLHCAKCKLLALGY